MYFEPHTTRFPVLVICLPCRSQHPCEFKDHDLFELFLLHSWRAVHRGHGTVCLFGECCWLQSWIRKCKGNYISDAFSKSKALHLVFWTITVISWGPVVRSSCVGISAGPMGKRESGSLYRPHARDSQLSSCMIHVWTSMGKFFKSMGQASVRVILGREGI